MSIRSRQQCFLNWGGWVLYWRGDETIFCSVKNFYHLSSAAIWTPSTHRKCWDEFWFLVAVKHSGDKTPAPQTCVYNWWGENIALFLNCQKLLSLYFAAAQSYTKSAKADLQFFMWETKAVCSFWKLKILSPILCVNFYNLKPCRFCRD